MNIESQEQAIFSKEELDEIQSWATDFNNELPKFYIHQIKLFVEQVIQQITIQLSQLMGLQIDDHQSYQFYFDQDLQLKAILKQQSISAQSNCFEFKNVFKFKEQSEEKIKDIQDQFIQIATQYIIIDEPKTIIVQILNQDPEIINNLLQQNLKQAQQNIKNQLIDYPKPGAMTLKEFELYELHRLQQVKQQSQTNKRVQTLNQGNRLEQIGQNCQISQSGLPPKIQNNNNLNNISGRQQQFPAVQNFTSNTVSQLQVQQQDVRNTQNILNPQNNPLNLENQQFNPQNLQNQQNNPQNLLNQQNQQQINKQIKIVSQKPDLERVKSASTHNPELANNSQNSHKLSGERNTNQQPQQPQQIQQLSQQNNIKLL